MHTFIIGEHGDSELAVWSSANVSGLDLKDYFPICENCGKYEDLYGIYDYVKNSAYEIIKGKGATYYAIAQATLRIVTSIIKDQNTILPVSTLVDGHYGLNDLCISVPAVVGAKGINHVLDIPLSEDENKRLAASAKALKNIINSVRTEPIQK